MKTLPFLIKNKKSVFIVIGLTLLIIAIVWIVKKRQRDNTFSENQIQVNKSNLSIDDNTASLIVRNLFQAMDKVGTDEQVIIENLSGLNKDDLLLVIEKFGVKPYYGNGLDTFSGFEKFMLKLTPYGMFSKAADKDLIGWLKSELSGAKLDQVKEIFTSNGIPF